MASKHGASVSVTDQDRGLNAMLERLDRSAFGAKLIVGLVGDEAEASHAGGELSISEIGEIHEFGLGVPRRSFIADWVDENEERHRSQIRKIAEQVMKGKIESWDQGLERLGVLYVAEVQKRIAVGIDPPLAPSTIARKGSSKPLIDTGALRSAITYKVE